MTSIRPLLVERQGLAYRPEADRYDELMAPDGRVRPAWRALVRALDTLPDGELARRRQRAERLLLAEGASHVLHGERRLTPGAVQGPTSRPWPVDPIPFVIDAEEWQALVSGLSQRARLLEEVLADVYGPRHLFTSGRLAPEAVYGYRGYQRAVAGPIAGRRRHLMLYGADVVRTADGRLTVLRDRTDAPTGLGYALVTRRALALTLAEGLRDEPVLPLTPFTRAVRATLAAEAPPDRLSPRVVILSPGFPHRHYFEHSFLAAHLGYHLAEGADLTVRDGRVWLRALGGLEPVDVLLRRLDDLTADPLEGERAPRTAPGVPGLIQAQRQGSVGVVNPSGSGAAQTLALAPAMPALARHLLGEDLRLPTVPTLWCGDEEHRNHVLAHIDRLVLHQLDPADPVTVFGDHLDEAEREAWCRRIVQVPHRVAAQERIDFATVPTLSPSGEQLVPGTAVLRVLLVATRSGWQALPGGVARVVIGSEPVLGQHTGTAKDVWVQAPPGASREAARVRPSLPQVDLRSSLPTRVAEALHWIGRNAERSEQTARFARVVVQRWEQAPELDELGGREGLAAALAGLRAVSGAGRRAGPEPADADTLAEVQGALNGGRGSLTDSLDHFLAATVTVREYLSGGTWRLLGQLADERAALAATTEELAPERLPDVVDLLDRVLVALMALAGLEDESMTRGPGWRFLDLGRRLERALLLGGNIEAVLGRSTPEEVTAVLGEVVLEAHESLVVYRRRFRSDVDLEQVLELLLVDEANPRGFTPCLDRQREHLAALPWGDRAAAQATTGLVDDAARALLERDAVDLRAVRDGRRIELDRLIRAARAPLFDLGPRLASTWFADRAGVPSHRWED